MPPSRHRAETPARRGGIREGSARDGCGFVVPPGGALYSKIKRGREIGLDCVRVTIVCAGMIDRRGWHAVCCNAAIAKQHCPAESCRTQALPTSRSAFSKALSLNLPEKP